MPRDLTPDKPAKWWVWSPYTLRWEKSRAAFAALWADRGYVVCLSNLKPKWIPQ